LGRLVRAALSRKVTPSSNQVVLVLEEVQEVLTRQEARSLSRLLSLARFRRVSIWPSHQAKSQITRIDRDLSEAMATNLGAQVQFRCSLADAQAFAHLLPHDEPSAAGAASRRRERIEELTHLGQRRFYFSLRDAPFRAQLIVAPRLDLEALKATVETAAPSLVEPPHAAPAGETQLEVWPEPAAASPDALPPTPPTMPVEPADEFPELG
jgi:cell division septation protein DedD